MADLHTDVRYIKGIGETRAKALAKLGITTLQELIGYFPRRYEDRTMIRPIRELAVGETVCVRAMLANDPTASRISGGRTVVKARAVDESGALELTFFNQEYRKNSLHRGETYIFCGRVEGNLLLRRMTNPIVEVEGRQLLTGRIIPIYPLTAGVSQGLLYKAEAQGLEACRHLLSDCLPDAVRQAHSLCHSGFAYENIHFPASPEALELARRRLVFEELFLLSCGLQMLRSRRRDVAGPACRAADMEKFYKTLPFSLTNAQRKAIGEAMADMTSGRPMNRLCQGDVGSGKTMVAAAAAYCAAINGCQSALMAPTEILAEQHYASLSSIFAPMGITVALLTGSMTQKEKKTVREALENGEVQIAVGTHALISESTVFRNLGLVITDEQHRFGVGQRSRLSSKGEAPHLLVMSATPIPRTLALLMYGDLDVSILDELPPGRETVDTFLVSESYRPRINAFIRKQVAQGHQCFVVCPAVEENDGLDVKSATVWAETLQKTVFPDLRIALLHGQMKGAEKEAAMAAFARQEADVLVATTVIEVGVDVPNATLMVIEDADRFGLSQLHQLRGRVGRGKSKSYCILTTHNRNPETIQRLKALCKTTDGFQIAEEDLKLRGPGDFFGSRQSGLPAFRMADLSFDLGLLKQAQQASAQWIEEEGTQDTPEANALRSRVAVLFSRAEGTMN